MTASDPEISLNVSRILKLFVYSAVAIMLLAVVVYPFSAALAKSTAAAGIAVVTVSPLAGVVLAGVISYRKGNRKLLLVSIFIIVIFIAAWAVSA